MIHVPQNAVGVIDDLTTSYAFDMRYEADAAIVVFVARIIQSARFRRSIRWSKWSWILIAADIFHGFVPYVVFRLTRGNGEATFSGNLAVGSG